MAEPALQDLIAAEVRAEMARQRVTGGRLAAELGVSAAWVSTRLAGITEFRVSDLERIAVALNVPVSRFLTAGERAA
jgi:transcriptional regulator with XRE-family HTH domain